MSLARIIVAGAALTAGFGLSKSPTDPKHSTKPLLYQMKNLMPLLMDKYLQ